MEGAADLPYSIPNLQVELHSPRPGIPIQWWRSVGATHTAFSTETIVDELAVLAGKDAVAFRSELLDKFPRHKGVLKLAADKAGWGKPLSKGTVSYTHLHRNLLMTGMTTHIRDVVLSRFGIR